MTETTKGTQNASTGVNANAELDVDYKCGLFFYPKFLQVFANVPCAMAAISIAACLQSAMVNGTLYAVFQSIERQFQLTSFQSGLMSFAYNVGSIGFLIPVSYIATNRHRPRIMAIGCLFMALGSFVFALPHFLAPPYTIFSMGVKDLCQFNSTSNVTVERNNTSTENFIFPLWYFFMISQFITGAASAPYYTSMVAYLDDNMTPYMAAFYVGFYYFITMVAPAVGLIIAGRYLDHFTNPDVNVAALGLTPRSPVWVGLWWEQFVYFGVFNIFAAIPVAAVPKIIPASKKDRPATLKKEQVEMNSRLESLWKSLTELILNPVYIFMTFGMTMDLMIATAISSQGPKLLTVLHNLSTGKSGSLQGNIVLVGGAGGSLLGGVTVKKMKLSSYGTAKLCLGTAILTWFCFFGYLARCENIEYIGVNNGVIDNLVPYSDCGNVCNCPKNAFNPVCTVDSKVFTSACAAGCKSELDDGYTNCSCVNETSDPGKPQAGNPLCDNVKHNCSRTSLWIKVVASAICLFAAFFTSAPCISVSLREIKAKQKSLAMGLQWFIIRVFGLVPAAMLFGYMIDLGCNVWQKKEGSSSSACALYNNDKVAVNVFIVFIVIKTISVICFALATFKLSQGSAVKNAISSPQLDTNQDTIQQSGIPNKNN